MESQCQVCGVLVTKKNAARHLQSHEEDAFRCDICDSYFKTKNSLYQHSKTHRNPELILRLEQEFEHLHQIMNGHERRFKSTYNKETRYWQMLEAHENKIYATK